MANYIKISELENKELSEYIITNNKFDADSFNSSLGDKTTLSDIVLFQSRDNNIPESSLFVALNNIYNSFNCIVNGSNTSDLLVSYEANNKFPIFKENLLIQNSQDITLDIPNNNINNDEYYNEYLINFFKPIEGIHSTESIISYEVENPISSITRLTVKDKGVTGLKLNLNSLVSLYISGCTNLVTFYPGQFNALQIFTLKNTSVNGPLIISKVSKNAKIEIINNGIQYLEIEGTDNIFNKESLKINDPKLRYLRIINCSIDEESLYNIIENCPLLKIIDPQSGEIIGLNIEQVLK